MVVGGEIDKADRRLAAAIASGRLSRTEITEKKRELLDRLMTHHPVLDSECMVSMKEEGRPRRLLLKDIDGVVSEAVQVGYKLHLNHVRDPTKKWAPLQPSTALLDNRNYVFCFRDEWGNELFAVKQWVSSCEIYLFQAPSCSQPLGCDLAARCQE